MGLLFVVIRLAVVIYLLRLLLIVGTAAYAKAKSYLGSGFGWRKGVEEKPGERPGEQPEDSDSLLNVSLAEQPGEQPEDSDSLLNVPPAEILREVEEKYQQFIKTRVDPLFGASREAQLQELNVSGEFRISPEERRTNRQFLWSGGLVTVGLVTLKWNPGVRFLVCMPVLFGVIGNTYGRAYRSMRERRGPTIELIGAINATLVSLGGFFTLAGIVTTLSGLGRKLNLITEDRAHDELVNIFGKQARHVWVLVDGTEVAILLEELRTGDTLVVLAGEMVAADGVIIHGHASIDQHRLTGESQPVEKGVGDEVLAATVVLAGRIHVRVEQSGKETCAAQITEVLGNSTSYQMNIVARAKDIADASVTPTLLVSALAGAMVGIEGAVTVTTSGFGNALYAAGPIALLGYLNVASRELILIKDGRSLELLPQVDTVIFDKTGTLTLDQPHVTRVHALGSLAADAVLAYTAAVEQRQTHPIARAILTYAAEQDVSLPEMDEVQVDIGYGIQGSICGSHVRVGSRRYMEQAGIPLSAQVTSLQEDCHAAGRSLVLTAIDDELVGVVELEPTVRPEAKRIIEQLRGRGLDFYIISGDQEGPTRSLAESLGIDHYFANTLPENKAALVEQLQRKGRSVCFVGDGINDSIALKKANVSVSLSGATSVATDTAQVVFMSGSLEQFPLLFQLADELESNLNTAKKLAIVPSIGIWAGVFVFHLGLFGGAVIAQASMGASIWNALKPLRKYKDEEARDQEESHQDATTPLRSLSV